MERIGRLDVSEADCMELVDRKTACLFSVCMQMGAILADATPEDEKRVAEYGRNLGMAFQIVDDVLDLTASEEILGKPVASDLREGKVTMAVVHALERASAAERELVGTVLRERTFKSVSYAHILEMLQRYGSLEAAMERAQEYSEAARQAICNFPDSEFKRALLWAPEFVVAREK